MISRSHDRLHRRVTPFDRRPSSTSGQDARFPVSSDPGSHHRTLFPNLQIPSRSAAVSPPPPPLNIHRFSPSSPAPTTRHLLHAAERPSRSSSALVPAHRPQSRIHRFRPPPSSPVSKPVPAFPPDPAASAHHRRIHLRDPTSCFPSHHQLIHGRPIDPGQILRCSTATLPPDCDATAAILHHLRTVPPPHGHPHLRSTALPPLPPSLAIPISVPCIRLFTGGIWAQT